MLPTSSRHPFEEGAADVVCPYIPDVLVVFDAGTDGGEDSLDGNLLAASVASRIAIILPNDFLL